MILAVILFVVLMGLDLGTTFLGFQFGAIEGNPLWPVEFMPWVKITATIIIIGMLWVVWTWRVFYARLVAYGMNAVMGFVVVNNAIVIAHLHQG